jgi:hypothetical protein
MPYYLYNLLEHSALQWEMGFDRHKAQGTVIGTAAVLITTGCTMCGKAIEKKTAR